MVTTGLVPRTHRRSRSQAGGLEVVETLGIIACPPSNASNRGGGDDGRRRISPSWSDTADSVTAAGAGAGRAAGVVAAGVVVGAGAVGEAGAAAAGLGLGAGVAGVVLLATATVDTRAPVTVYTTAAWRPSSRKERDRM